MLATQVRQNDSTHYFVAYSAGELIRGRLVVRERAGFRHGVVAVRIARYLPLIASALVGVVLRL